MGQRGLKKIFITRLTDVDATDKEGIGTIRWEGNSGYKYVQIKNHTATVAGVAGDAVAYYAATGYASHRVVIDLSDADGTVAFAAGILMGTVIGTLDVAYYGWIQIQGPATTSQSVGSAAAGKTFKLTTTDKTFTVVTAATDNIAGISMNTTTGVCLTCQI